ncbi:unnamed protein product [Polarella glacialis]|uniref:Uncharacterized protein n=1 Tax=Polarella glacialis TaxID=89957 RepID=A0A813K1C2_POLGL|nr:unnamed protein product [Polarella glacialis]
MAHKNGTGAHSAACWDSDLSARDFQHCARSPIDMSSQKARHGDGLQPNISFKSVPEALVTPGVYSLDATAVNHGVPGELGDFGTLVVNGRGFMVRKISVKAISSHSWDGKMYPGELQIEATMNGDEFPGLENKSAQAASLANHAGTAEAVPYVPEKLDQSPTSDVEHFDHLHRVIISVPLALALVCPNRVIQITDHSKQKTTSRS